MLRRIAAITLILLCTSVGWFILAGTIEHRTNQFDEKLRQGVVSVWGSPQKQAPPAACFTRGDRTFQLPIESSRINVSLNLAHRQKGLLWYSTYVVDFAGVYTFRNPSDSVQVITFTLRFPAGRAIYDGLAMEVNGRAVPVASSPVAASGAAEIAGGQLATFRVSYRSHGLENWSYGLGDSGGQVRDFALTMRTNFDRIDFPLNTLSPTEKRETSAGWQLTWAYRNLISGLDIGVAMPGKLQPGPLAGQISYFAPVSLLLFFFLIFIITTLRAIDLHPMNYFFLAAAFFSFHLLLAYLVDHISIHLAFPICSAVSVFLVVSYLRLVVGPRFALVEAGGAQFVYLVLFSYAFLLEGYTGLAVTIGCIVTLFVVMQMTARLRWSERFAKGK